MVILLLVAVVGLAQEAFDVITQLTICPFVKVVVVYVALLVPTLLPFTFHWYDGVVPPLTGVAVKVAEEPAQIGFVPAVCAIVTDGVDTLLTVMVIAFEVAGLPVTPAWLEVMTQVTTSPLTRLLVEYVVLLVPTFVPFTFH